MKNDSGLLRNDIHFEIFESLDGSNNFLKNSNFSKRDNFWTNQNFRKRIPDSERACHFTYNMSWTRYINVRILNYRVSKVEFSKINNSKNKIWILKY